jgi:hypothetical protein
VRIKTSQTVNLLDFYILKKISAKHSFITDLGIQKPKQQAGKPLLPRLVTGFLPKGGNHPLHTACKQQIT